MRAWALDCVGLRTKTGENAREHHMARHRRWQREKAPVHFRWSLALLRCPPPPGPWVVTLTRVAPTPKHLELPDDDNVVAGLKAVRDQVAAELGVDDGDRAAVRWVYALPERGPWAVRILVETDPTAAGAPLVARGRAGVTTSVRQLRELATAATYRRPA